MNRDYVNSTLKAQANRLRLEALKMEAKRLEIFNYLNGNPHKAILCNYYEGEGYGRNGGEGGYEYGHVFDFTYVGKHILTKYNAALTVKSYDAERDLIHFVEDHDPLGPSRISEVDLDEESYRNYREREEFVRNHPDFNRQ